MFLVCCCSEWGSEDGKDPKSERASVKRKMEKQMRFLNSNFLAVGKFCSSLIYMSCYYLYVALFRLPGLKW